MTAIFDRFGVPTIINAKGPATRLSGGPLDPRVAAAMAEAASACVEMTALEARASEIIAAATGADAGYVTSGAAAGLLLGTAAAITGLDPAAMARLPETEGLKNEVVMIRSQRNQYDHAVRAAGARIVEVGLPDRFAGAGVRDAEGWEIAAAIGPRTAAVFYVADSEARPDLATVVAAAHAAGVPVIVDAAAQLPPAANLRRFIAEGADLVAFSGGKVLGGPQASGILCGRRDLIMAAALQHLDLDVFEDSWAPPPSLINRARLSGIPPHGIGRPCKAGREAIVGLLTALEIFLSEKDEARHTRWLARLNHLLKSLPARASLVGADDRETVPTLLLDLGSRDGAISAAAKLEGQRIHVDATWRDRGRLVINPVCLREEDLAPLAAALKAVLG